MSPDKQLQNVQYGDGNVSYFFKDNFSFYLFKKVEKLVLALHLITEHLSDKEPIRQGIRETSMSFIKDIMTSLNKKDISEIEKDIQNVFFEIDTLLGIGDQTRLLTSANVSIIKSEISKISKELKSHVGSINNSPIIQKAFFEVEQSQQSNLVDSSNIKDKKDKQYKKDISNKSVSEKIERTSSENRPKSNKKTMSQNTVNKTVSNNKGSNRTDQVIAIVKSKGKVTIKDIALEITDCSEKTIQRELQKLVNNGILNREGERRWSQYSIK